MTNRSAIDRSTIHAIVDDYDERLEELLASKRLSDKTRDRIRAEAVAELTALLEDAL